MNDMCALILQRNRPKLTTPAIKKSRLLHGVSVPDLRSDGESTSNDRTPPSASSSTRSSNPSSNIWTGSLPNLTVQLSTESTKKDRQKKPITDPYATFADHLNEIDIQPKSSPPRRSLPIPYQSQTSMYSKVRTTKSLHACSSSSSMQ